MTIAKVYGLKENPFEPTGAAVGKYPFVPPENFPILEQKIEEAGIEKKFYALLVNSPHGAGKSTTMEYLKTKAINGGYLSFQAPVILTKLSSLSIQDFVQDILEEASKHGRVKSLPRSKYGHSPSKLRNILVSTLSPIAAKNKLMLWIVDEFDILADQPPEKQQAFLQFLRGVIDGFASSDIPIAFIMSHTKYSSREFERHLSEQHEPFRSRLVASVPLAYSFDEVKKIVFLRLEKASSSPRQEGDLSPFSEQALKSLYELILSVRGTESLDNFRVFERVCHFALIEGAKRDLKEIDTRLIQELFKQYGLKEVLVRERRRLSIKTSQEIAAIKSKSLMERNEAILQGIVAGISKSAFLGGEGTLSNVQTSYMGPVGVANVVLSSLSFNLLHQGRTINLLWVIATNKVEIIQDKDLKEILQMIASRPKVHKPYAHLQLLSYVSSVDVRKIPTNPFDRVLWFSDGLAEDLIGLSVGVDEDSEKLVGSFNDEIAPLLSQLVARETRDMTAPLKQPAYEAIRTLYVMSAAGQSCTKEAVRQYNKRLFMRKSKIQERYIKEAVQSGFAQEEAGQLKPAIPKAHAFLIDLLKDSQEYPELLRKLGGAGEAIVDSALAFGLIREDGNQIVKRSLADYEKEVSSTIKSLEEARKNEAIKQSEPGKWIEWLLNAHESAKESEHAYSRYVILSTIKELGPKIKDEVDKYLVKTPREIAKAIEPISEPSTIVPPEAEPAEVVEAPEPVLERPLETIDDAILQIVQTSGAMSIQEIDNRMKQKGYEEDIKRTVFRLILEGKLKVISAG